MKVGDKFDFWSLQVSKSLKIEKKNELYAFVEVLLFNVSKVIQSKRFFCQGPLIVTFFNNIGRI